MPFPPKADTWVTGAFAGAREIPIDDMDVEHLRNCLKMIMRRAREGRLWKLGPTSGGLRFVEPLQVGEVVPLQELGDDEDIAHYPEDA